MVEIATRLDHLAGDENRNFVVSVPSRLSSGPDIQCVMSPTTTKTVPFALCCLVLATSRLAHESRFRV